jgi:hypothetical protein
VDDFCWIAARCPNVYAGLAVVLAYIHNRPRWFAEVVANLLFWLGPDRIIYGTDFPIWYPHWQLDDFMAFELPEDLKREYDVDLTPEIKQKIVGGNIVRLLVIDVPAKLAAIKEMSSPVVAASTWPVGPFRGPRGRRSTPGSPEPNPDDPRRADPSRRRRSRTRRFARRSPSWGCSTRSR